MSLSARLLLLPQWLTILLLIGSMVSMSIAGFLVVHRYIPVKTRKIHNDVAGFVFGSLGATYGVLLAFMVLVVWGQLNDAQRDVVSEDSAMIALYHNIAAYPDQATKKVLVTGLAQYVRLSSQQAEMERPGQDTNENIKTIEELMAVFKQVKPDSPHQQILYSQILQNLNDLVKYRKFRLQAAYEELPSVVWIGVVVGALIVISCTFLFGTENVWAHIIIMSLMASLIAIIIYVVIELDHPTIGIVKIETPKSYAKVAELAQLQE